MIIWLLYYEIVLIHIQMSKEPSAKDYQKIKKNYKKMLVKGIKISPKKKKKKKRQYWREQYKCLADEKKQRFAEYRKDYFKEWGKKMLHSDHHKWFFFISIVCSINICYSHTKYVFMILRLLMHIKLHFKQCKKFFYIFNIVFFKKV